MQPESRLILLIFLAYTCWEQQLHMLQDQVPVTCTQNSSDVDVVGVHTHALETTKTVLKVNAENATNIFLDS